MEDVLKFLEVEAHRDEPKSADGVQRREARDGTCLLLFGGQLANGLGFRKA